VITNLVDEEAIACAGLQSQREKMLFLTLILPV
jgi:hypothetical protein